MYLLKAVGVWIVADSIPQIARAYNERLQDQRLTLFKQHLYALKLKQRKRGMYKGVTLEVVAAVPTELPSNVTFVDVSQPGCVQKGKKNLEKKMK